MVYLNSWHEFQEAAESLYAKSPFKTRYSVKWKAEKSLLVLKITDDVSCLKFKTHSSIMLNRFEALNLSLMEKMQNYRPPVLKAEPIAMEVDTPGASGAGGAPTSAAQAAATSAAAKKKKSKKKK